MTPNNKPLKTRKKNCIACGKPIGIPPKWKRVLKKLGFYQDGLWVNYCTSVPIHCEKHNIWHHLGCLGCHEI